MEEVDVGGGFWSAISCLLLIRMMITREVMLSFGLSLWLSGKESACNEGDPSLIPGLGRSAGEGIGYPLQYSGLENSMNCIIMGSQGQT